MWSTGKTGLSAALLLCPGLPAIFFLADVSSGRVFSGRDIGESGEYQASVNQIMISTKIKMIGTGTTQNFVFSFSYF